MIDNSQSLTEQGGRFSERELEIIKNFENARHLQDLLHHPGWRVFLQLKDKRMEQVKEQFMLMDGVNKEALLAAQIRLKGIMEFIGALLEGIENAVECLDPEAMKQILQTTVINPADLDGELNLKEL